MTTAETPQLTPSYTGPSEQNFKRRRDQLESAMLTVMMDQAAKQKEQPDQPRMAQSPAGGLAAAMGLAAFGKTPKSVI